MRFGISNIIPILFICLNIQLGYSQATRVSEFKTSTFMGKECDDTEYRNYNGRPNWKNYGQWLSECDSLSDTYYDSVFAVQRAEKSKQKAIQDSIDIASVEDIDFDMDAMWEQAVWEEITEVVDSEPYETEYITAVAGVRGAEAEDEALHHLYYRKSMKGIALVDLQKAYGKLKIKRDEFMDADINHPKLKQIDNLLAQLKIKMKKT